MKRRNFIQTLGVASALTTSVFAEKNPLKEKNKPYFFLDENSNVTCLNENREQEIILPKGLLANQQGNHFDFNENTQISFFNQGRDDLQTVGVLFSLISNDENDENDEKNNVLEKSENTDKIKINLLKNARLGFLLS